MKILFQQHFSPSFAILSEYDVIQTIYVTIKELKTKNILPELSIAHVKGHQDEEKDYEDLSVEAKLNVQADHRAGEHMKQTSVIKQGTLIIPAKLQMRIDNKEITRNIRQSIRFKYSAEQLQLYIMKKNNWTDQDFYSVNWEASRQAHKKSKA